MSKLEKLTKEQEAQMQVFRDKYIDNFKSCKRPEKRKIKKGIDMIYKLAGYKNPKIIYVKSPLGAQLLANILKDKELSASVGDSVRDSVWDSVWDSVGDSVGDSVRDSVWASVRDSVWDSVRASKMEFYSFSSYGSIYDYGWVAFYDYFESIWIDLGKATDNFHTFKDMILGGVYDMIQFEWYCIVVELPESFSQNANKRLHNDKWPAIRFKDGYELYRINGMKIETKEEFDKIVNDKYTVAELLAIENNDTRAVAYEYFNKEKFATEPHKVLDEQVDDKWNPMKIVEFNDKKIGRYYVGICPSTSKTHYLATMENTCIRAKEASFWLKDVCWVQEY